MKPLPGNLKKNGYDYIQVERGRKALIYEQWFQGRIVAWEVFKLKTSPPKQIKGRLISARERFPHNEAFGNWAWVYTSWTKALQRYNQLEFISENLKQMKYESS